MAAYLENRLSSTTLRRHMLEPAEFDERPAHWRSPSALPSAPSSSPTAVAAAAAASVPPDPPAFTPGPVSLLHSLPDAPFGPHTPRPEALTVAPRAEWLQDLPQADVQIPAPPPLPSTAGPDAPEPPSPAADPAPTASALEIAILELALADPLNQELVAAYGGSVPAMGAGETAQSQVARYGADLAARLSQLSHAQNGVRGQYLQAMDQAAQHAGPGTQGAVFVPGSWSGGDSDPVPDSWRFDAVAFTQSYAQGDSLAQRAFAALHGPDALVHEGSWGGGDSDFYTESWTLAGAWTLKPPQQTDLDGHPNRERMGWIGAALQSGASGVVQIDLNAPPSLHQASAVWFDPSQGWVTAQGNLVQRQSFLDKAVPIVFTGVMTWATAGAFGIAGGAGVASGTGIGAAGSGLAGAMTAGAAFGAIGSFYGGIASDGRIDLKNILRGALTGAVTAGIGQGTGLNNLGLNPNGTVASYAQRALSITGQATLQGALQEIAGGRFRDGFTSAMAQGLGAEVARGLNLKIAELSTGPHAIDPAQAAMLKQFARAAQSAVGMLANPEDPGHAFALTFMQGLVGDVQQGLTARAVTDSASPTWASAPDQMDAETARLAGAGSEQPNDAASAFDGSSVTAGASVESAPAATSNSTLRIEIIGTRLPNDDQGNRFELNAAGDVIVYRPDGGLLRVEAAQAQASGLTAELTAALATRNALPALGTVSVAPQLGAVLSATLRIGGPLALLTAASNGSGGPVFVDLGAEQRFVHRPGELWGELQKRDVATGQWVIQRAQGFSNGAGHFEVLTEAELARLQPPITTPLQQQPPSSPAPLPSWADRPEALPGLEPVNPSDQPDLAGQPMETPDWRDSLLTRDELEQRRFRGRVIGEMFASDPGFDPKIYEAHHILPLSEYPDLQDLRDRFVNDWQIDLNDLENGVALPKNAGVGSGTPHRQTQGNPDYELALRSRFESVTTREEALFVLGQIKQELRDSLFIGPKGGNP